MNGILLIDKDKGMTSHDVVNKVRRILDTRKVGHTGTLDPIATGLLPVLVGEGTKISNYIVADDKEYIATAVFGNEYTTYDITGDIVASTENIPDEAYVINNKITNSLIDGLVHQYAWYKSRDEYGQATVVQVNNICCLGYEDIYGNKYDMMDGVDLPNDSGNQGKWRIWMPDGSIRMVQGKTASDQWTTGVAHGKYMDLVPVGNLNGSSSTYYTDKYWISTATVRVV